MSATPHTVLFVDDEENILEVLKRLLRKENYRLLTASSGAEGLRLIKKTKVNLVVSDQRMPGMLGTEFLRRVKEEYPHILTAILTGYADLETMKESVNTGHVFRFFLKPWDSHALKQDIRKMLYEYESRDMAKTFEKRVIRHVMALSRKDMARAREVAKHKSGKTGPGAYSLALSLAILEDLPMAIIGVDSGKNMVLANREARSLITQGVDATGSGTVADLLSVESASLEEKIDESLAECTRKTLEGYPVSGKAYDIDVIPLSGKYAGQGAYLKFTPVSLPGA